MRTPDHPPERPVAWLAWPADCGTVAERLARSVRVRAQHWLPARDEAARLLGLLREQVEAERAEAPE